jgi:predicted acylesterase/phospholipase RssA
MLLPFLALKHRRISGNLMQDLGITTTTDFADWLEQTLCAKFPGAPTPIPFKYLKPLKVIATNVTRGELRIFGGEQDCDRSVTEAVIASASFPLFFRPASIEGELYVDGGLLSNLPAWVFDEERRRSGVSIPTFGFRLIDPPIEAPDGGSDEGLPGLLAYIRSMARTAVYGARRLETRAVDDYYSFDLVPNISTLAFHEMQPRAAEIVAAGRSGVERFFDQQIGPRDPGEMRAVLRVFSNFIQQALRRIAGPIEVVRCELLLPIDEYYLRVIYSSHADADDRLLVRREGPGIAASFRLRHPVLVKVQELDHSIRNHPLYKYEYAVRPSNVRVTHASPIFDDPAAWQRTPENRSSPFAVFAFDATSDIGDVILQEEIEDRLASYAQLAGEWLRKLQLVPSGDPSPRFGEQYGAWNALAEQLGCYISSRPTRTLFEDDDTRRLIERVNVRVQKL